MTLAPVPMGKFQFARLASLRAVQLFSGCTPRIVRSLKLTTTAQREVAAGKIRAIGDVSDEADDAADGRTPLE